MWPKPVQGDTLMDWIRNGGLAPAAAHHCQGVQRGGSIPRGQLSPPCFEMFGQAGAESIIRALGSAEDVMKAISWWTIVGLKEDTRGQLPMIRLESSQLRGHSSGTTDKPSDVGFFLETSADFWTDSVWCLCSPAPKSSEKLFLLMLICSVLGPRFTARSAFSDTIFPFVSVKVLPSHCI